MADIIITDIEGTTSSLSFVKEVLFPYAYQHLADFVWIHGETPEVRACLDAARTDAGMMDLDDAGVVQMFLTWIQEDRKATSLKALQGLIWEAGYRNGAYQGHIYADAEASLRAWHAAGKRLYVFSSGSIKAQKLLFAHTAYGDLTALFSGYFDTTTGPKQSSQAYRTITQAVNGGEAGNILFLSDIIGELDAAREAGLKTYCLVRDGDLPTSCGHPLARNFSEIQVDWP